MTNVRALVSVRDLRGRRLDLRELGPSLFRTVHEDGYALAHTSGLTDRQLLSLGRQFGCLWDPTSPIMNVWYIPKAGAEGLSRNALPPHCECSYDAEPPRYVLLHCKGASKAGGEIYLVAMREVLRRLSAADNRSLHTTPYFIKSHRSDASATRTLIASVDGVGEVLVLSSVPPRGAKPNYPVPIGADRAADSLLRRVSRVAANPALRLGHRWRKGDILIIDNARFLHGREGFTGARRHLQHVRVGRFTA